MSLSVGCCLAALIASNINLGAFARNLKPFIWLFLLTFLIHIVMTSGPALYRVPVLGLPISEEGVTRACFFTTRLAILLTLGALLTMTTSPIALTDGLGRLLSPLKGFKLPVDEFVLMIMLSLRFLPIILQEADRVRLAQQARGATTGGGLLTRVRSVPPMITPLFMAAFRRADELAAAMDARIYASGQRRTTFSRLELRMSDYSVLALTSAILIVSIAV